MVADGNGEGLERRKPKEDATQTSCDGRWRRNVVKARLRTGNLLHRGIVTHQAAGSQHVASGNRFLSSCSALAWPQCLVSSL